MIIDLREKDFEQFTKLRGHLRSMDGYEVQVDNYLVEVGYYAARDIEARIQPGELVSLIYINGKFLLDKKFLQEMLDRESEE